jgi:hypothetical protein
VCRVQNRLEGLFKGKKKRSPSNAASVPPPPIVYSLISTSDFGGNNILHQKQEVDNKVCVSISVPMATTNDWSVYNCRA